MSVSIIRSRKKAALEQSPKVFDFISVELRGLCRIRLSENASKTHGRSRHRITNAKLLDAKLYPGVNNERLLKVLDFPPGT